MGRKELEDRRVKEGRREDWRRRMCGQGEGLERKEELMSKERKGRKEGTREDWLEKEGKG